MHVLEEKDKCCGCETCSNACPVNAISMKYDEEGFFHPTIDEKACILCGICKKICPVESPPVLNKLKNTFACYAKDEEIFYKSSSGGFFAVLANEVLNESGLVCGAAFDYNNMVKHTIIDDKSQLKTLQGTKYVQSRINDLYRKIQQYLEDERIILFSGTPCQVAGLKSFLRDDYDRLICIDIICHGVPSPMVWEDYLKSISKSGKIQSIDFRKKDINSGKSYFVYRINDNDFAVPYEDNLYIKGFIKNLYLRESCFKCQFKGYERCSDITIGDFWGIKEKHFSFANKSGNSIVIIHSEKGQKWFEKVKKHLCFEKAAYVEASVFNESVIESVKKTKLRELFYDQWKNGVVSEIIEKIVAEENLYNNQHAEEQDTSILRKIIKKVLSR